MIENAKKQFHLLCLLRIAGNDRYLTVILWIPSALSTLLALVPSYSNIWLMLRVILETGSDFGCA